MSRAQEAVCEIASRVGVSLRVGRSLALEPIIALGDGSGDPTAVKNEDGKYFDKEGNPTYKVQADGTVD